MREDYEPYTIESGGKTYWCFDVEYYGHYICQSESELQKEIKRVKEEVAYVLKKIEKRNAEYYKQLAEREAVTKQRLREARERKLQCAEDFKTKSKQQKNAEREEIREYIARGYSDGKILMLMPETTIRTISHVRYWYEKKEIACLLNDDLWK